MKFWTLCFLALSFLEARPLELGDDAPEFYLPDQEGFYHSLLQHRGSYVLLFFYPRDFIPFSKRMVRAFERMYQDLKAKNVIVYGVSSDPRPRHFNFHETFRLTYDLLSDAEQKVSKKYSAIGLLGPKFISYLIGPDGRVFRIYEEEGAVHHPHLALADIP